jgi:hypothetical protein
VSSSTSPVHFGSGSWPSGSVGAIERGSIPPVSPIVNTNLCRTARNGKGDAVARQRLPPPLCDSWCEKHSGSTRCRSRRPGYQGRACPHRAACFRTVRAFSSVPRSSPGLTASSASFGAIPSRRKAQGTYRVCLTSAARYRTHRPKTHGGCGGNRQTDAHSGVFASDRASAPPLPSDGA